MNQLEHQCKINIKAEIKNLVADDYIWLLHLINKVDIEYSIGETIDHSDKELRENNVEEINSTKSLNELYNLFLNKFDRLNNTYKNYLIDDIRQYISKTSHRSIDLSKYKSNNRMLAFVVNKINRDSYPEVDQINNLYFRFLYIVSICEINRDVTRKLNRAERKFSKIITEAPLHLKNHDTDEFYRWCFKYLLENSRDYSLANLKRHNPICDEDFKTSVMIILDQLYEEDNKSYIILKQKISNAWYQKTYRKENKGRKHYYFFTDKSYECLKVISKKKNLSEEKTIENLINEYFSKHCIYESNGNSKYSI